MGKPSASQKTGPQKGRGLGSLTQKLIENSKENINLTQPISDFLLETVAPDDYLDALEEYKKIIRKGGTEYQARWKAKRTTRVGKEKFEKLTRGEKEAEKVRRDRGSHKSSVYDKRWSQMSESEQRKERNKYKR